MSTKHVLITGTSTGIGHATAEYFAEHGWKVLAGSRHPEKLAFKNSAIQPIAIDVNDHASIERCFADPRIQAIDCVVNNAGYGLLLPFEDTPMEEIRKLFSANVFGLMDVCQRAIKIFRPRRAGAIINVASVLGRIGTPWYTAYGASKWAVEGFSESLACELRPFNVHVKIVEPTGTRTHFHEQAYGTEHLPITDVYRTAYEAKRSTKNQKRGVQYDTPEDVATLIFQAATDTLWQLRYMMPRTAETLEHRRKIGEEAYWEEKSR